MELFVGKAHVEALQARLTAAQGGERLAPLLALAWHLRQRQCERARACADEAARLLVYTPLGDSERRAIAARLQLVHAEVALLFADVPLAQKLLQDATQQWLALDDPAGLGDAYWLQASLWVDRGSSQQVGEALALADAQYRRTADPLRTAAVWARRLVHASFRDPGATAQALAQAFEPGQAVPAAVLAWVAAARANVAGLTDDPGTSIRHDLEAYHAALDSGQIRQALVSVTNAAESFTTLGDLDAALLWSERALRLARQTSWPASVGFCLMQLGDVMRLLGRHDEARADLQEALALMAGQGQSRNYQLGLAHLGQLALDQGDASAALASFNQLQQLAQAPAQPEADLLVRAWRGQASALLSLGRTAEAHDQATAALTLARERGHGDGQIQALRVLARCHTGHEALAPLNQALAVAAGMRGYPAPPELLDEVAAACAAVGDFEQAYHRHLQADAARQTSRLLEAQKRALAMQVRREVESARADTEHHRQLAATLKDTAATLETLGTIGREITASLDAQAVFAVLHRRVHQLLDATAFAVYLMAAHEPELVTAFGMEAGVPLPQRHIALEHPTSHVARCARSRQEILIELEPGVTTPQHIPGTLSTYTLLYAPLMAGERLLGVMTVQSSTLRAYGERERSIFHTLCAYSAIALDNAFAYAAAEAAQRRTDHAIQELRQAQAQLERDMAERQRIDQALHVLNSELEMRIALRTQEISATLERLAESKRKLQGIVDTALDAVVRVDAQGCIVGWNRQAVALFGWSPEQALGQALHDTIIPSHYRAAHHQGMARYMTGGESRVLDRRIEISAVDRSGREFPIELSITRVMLDDPTQFEFCAFIRDITRRRQAEQDVRDSLEKQRELNQLKSRFVSMASHEFRTPLATILSSSDLLRYYADRLPVAEREELFQSITDAVKRMTRMLEDVLVIGRDDDERARFHPQPLRVDDLCARLVQEVQAQLGGAPGHELRLRVHGDAVHGRFDEALMRHIFGNLLSNAIKYSPAGGVVGFEVQCGPEAFLFEVSDCGIGIPEVDLPHLFETFHRGTNVGNIAGTGLGLAIVKRSVDQHGGTLAVHSTLGQGTRFEVRLPRTPCEPLPP